MADNRASRREVLPYHSVFDFLQFEPQKILIDLRIVKTKPSDESSYKWLTERHWREIQKVLLKVADKHFKGKDKAKIYKYKTPISGIACKFVACRGYQYHLLSTHANLDRRHDPVGLACLYDPEIPWFDMLVIYAEQRFCMSKAKVSTFLTHANYTFEAKMLPPKMSHTVGIKSLFHENESPSKANRQQSAISEDVGTPNIMEEDIPSGSLATSAVTGLRSNEIE